MNSRWIWGLVSGVDEDYRMALWVRIKMIIRQSLEYSQYDYYEEGGIGLCESFDDLEKNDDVDDHDKWVYWGGWGSVWSEMDDDNIDDGDHDDVCEDDDEYYGWVY